jgi:hypothetical protein
MSTKKTALAGGSSNNTKVNHTTPKKLGKLNNVLSVFAGGESLNRFEAVNLGDTVLNTTISDLQRMHSIQFNRKMEKIKNRFGSKTNVMRYWLEGENLSRAQSILGWRPAA